MAGRLSGCWRTQRIEREYLRDTGDSACSEGDVERQGWDRKGRMSADDDGQEHGKGWSHPYVSWWRTWSTVLMSGGGDEKQRISAREFRSSKTEHHVTNMPFVVHRVITTIVECPTGRTYDQRIQYTRPFYHRFTTVLYRNAHGGAG